MNSAMAALGAGVWFCAVTLVFISYYLSQINARQKKKEETERRNMMRHLGANYPRR